MTKGLEKRQSEAATKIVKSVEEQHKENTIMEFGMMVGASSVANAIAQSTMAKSIRILQTVRDNKLYEAQGYARFDDFLNASPHSPMGYKTFNRYENLLKEEGEVVFETLNTIGVTLSNRKLLAGDVEALNENELRVGDETINLNDKTHVQTAIKALAEKRAKEQVEVKKLKEKLEKGADENTKLKQEIDRLKLGSPIDEDNSAHPHAVALMNLSVAFMLLADEAEQLEEDEKQQLAPRTFKTIAAQMDKLSIAYNRTSGGKTRKKKNDLPEVLPTVSDDELAELMD